MVQLSVVSRAESPEISSAIEALQAEFTRLKRQYANTPYPSLTHRLQRLTQLKQALLRENEALIAAVNQDYGFHSRFDSGLCDLLPTLNHLNYTAKQLKKWMKPQRRHAGWMLLPSRVEVQFQPLGVVGVMVPWNFPILLSLAPLITAVAAGNQVMVKLSEYTPATNQVLARVIAALGDIAVCVQGDAKVAAAFSALRFDHLLFTGSTAVGKLVAQAAAKNLTPVTLELGGKSPVIIADDADLARSVDNIMLGKTTNAGQICVAPDYVMLPQAKVATFVELYLQRFARRFIRHGRMDVTQIINQAQFDRLQHCLDDAQQKGAKLNTVVGKTVELEARQMLPHLLTEVSDDMLVMQQEIFGPILPVIGYRNIEEAIERVNQGPRPLALYVMTKESHLANHILQRTHSGGACVNDTLMHVAADDAPFGGIGESGQGHYHGIEGFKTFSHSKTVLRSAAWLPRSGWLLTYRQSMLRVLTRFFGR
ncbi:TPA: coniferyl aldehyde dehydrogenase [Vibrio cholerae]|nr:coniferyl aldehyde dehydrogenase [Vibrio cholerae]